MSGSLETIALRLATPEDIPELEKLIEASVRTLQRGDYSEAQMNGALGTVFGVDTQLIADGTYFVALAEGQNTETIVGCGGWSKRKTLFGSDYGPNRTPELLDPAKDAAFVSSIPNTRTPRREERTVPSPVAQKCAASHALFWLSLCSPASITLSVPRYFRGAHIFVRVDLGILLGQMTRAISSTLPRS